MLVYLVYNSRLATFTLPVLAAFEIETIPRSDRTGSEV
jgi:hypothetical protein